MRWTLILPGLLLGCAGLEDHWYFQDSRHEHPAEWSYEGETGPDHWGDLDPSYRVAKTGRRQSPIDIPTDLAIEKELAPLEFHYRPEPAIFINNGHTLQHDEAPGSWIVVGGQRYDLLQFHVHTPSEHTIDRQRYDLELHLVHRDSKGRVAVVAILASANRTAEPVLDLPEVLPGAGSRSDFRQQVTPTQFLPDDRSYYRYEGSFTTPPCTEGVIWFVLKHPKQLPPESLAKLKRTLGHNSRPVQPRYQREVFYGGRSTP